MKDDIILLMLVILSSCTEGFAINQQLPLKPGSCSRSCKTEHTEGQSEGQRRYKSPCSCSRSCSIYGDCCYDSIWRDKMFPSTGIMSARLSCLPLANIGAVSAISNCPNNWQSSNAFCIEGFGNLPPVTSRTTGVTYGNLFCAICNADSNNLVTWDVEMKCCSAYYSTTENPRETKFRFRNNTLWRVWVNEDKSHTFCECKYFALNGNYNFTNKLELRNCGREEISRCSSSWLDSSVSELCKSYLDPIYLQDEVYKNLHCAICNYENIHRDATCVEVRSKGRPYSITEMLRVLSLKCVPPPGSKCCAGERFDYKRNICRQLHT